MKKIKLLLLACIIFSLSACQDNTYVSLRHPAGEEQEEVKEQNEETTDTNDEDEDSENQEQEDSSKNNSTDGVTFRVSDTVNMRLAPSQNSAVVSEIGPDDEILNLGETEGWTRVTVNGKTGYIRSDLLIKGKN